MATCRRRREMDKGKMSMSTDDINGSDVAENIANIVMEKIRERDEVLITRLKSEITADFMVELEKRDQVLHQKIDNRDKALETRNQAFHEEIKSRVKALETGNQALSAEIKSRDQALQLAMEKGGVNTWKSAVQWATGTAATTSGIVLALGILLAQIISRSS